MDTFCRESSSWKNDTIQVRFGEAWQALDSRSLFVELNIFHLKIDL